MRKLTKEEALEIEERRLRVRLRKNAKRLKKEKRVHDVSYY